MSKKCGYCGATVADATLFCTKCGQRITSVNLSSRKKCPNCGQWLSPGKNSCLYCGYFPEQQNAATGSGRSLEEKSEHFDQVSVSGDHREQDTVQNPDPIRESEPQPWSNPYQTKSVKKRICPKCNRPIEDGFQFCIMCGTPVPEDESEQSPPDPETGRIDSDAEVWQDTSSWNKEEEPADDFTEPSPAAGGDYDASVELSPDTASHGEPPFTSGISSDFWNTDTDSEKERTAGLPDPASEMGEPADTASEEEDSGSGSLFISPDLLRAMNKEEQEDEIPMGFSAPTKL